jgi:hypothetical protein
MSLIETDLINLSKLSEKPEEYPVESAMKSYLLTGCEDYLPGGHKYKALIEESKIYRKYKRKTDWVAIKKRCL